MKNPCSAIMPTEEGQRVIEKVIMAVALAAMTSGGWWLQNLYREQVAIRSQVQELSSRVAEIAARDEDLRRRIDRMEAAREALILRRIEQWDRQVDRPPRSKPGDKFDWGEDY
jgi:outer membrane murein-binding lipoprotein Lpp